MPVAEPSSPAPEPPPFPQVLARFAQAPRELLGLVPGVLAIDKPSGPTSQAIVSRLRRQLRLKKIGHGGTLDPLAKGLLLVLLGSGTRLFDSLQNFTKTYRAELQLGLRTDTQDITGKVVATAAELAKTITADRLHDALAPFRGAIEQLPPMFSALKKDGQPLYKLARAGQEVERAPRPVTVFRLEMLAFQPERAQAFLELEVSKGFYVRTLIDDLGQKLGCGATMTALTRTAIGPFNLTDAQQTEAVTWDTLRTWRNS